MERIKAGLRTGRQAERLKSAPSLTLGVLIGIAILLIEAVRPDGVAPFIYFQF